ncbi:MAG TPA: hypothetical protein ENH84_06440 [Phycisphaerae bacterium]|nr:hypothetical protein [Phycisphaerae bacterium]
MIAWTIFYNPMIIPQNLVLWLLPPLCLSVAVVYKTIRVNNLRKLPVEIIVLMAYMIGGLIILGGILWAVQLLLI